MSIDYEQVSTPCYVCDNDRILKNLAILNSVQEASGCTLLLALKAFAMVSVFPLLKRTLKGTAASSLNEAKLGREEFGGMLHVYAPAYSDAHIQKLAQYADYMVFNSCSQWKRYRETVRQVNKKVNCGIRINPEYSVVKTSKYDPCGKFSRLGVVLDQLHADDLDGITGFHFHTHCESSAVDLERTLHIIERKFGTFIRQLRWVNLGGGYQLTRSDYAIDKLSSLVREFSRRYDVEVFMEPGEAVALNAGVLVATVLDIVHNEIDIAILDTSATAHMPDVLEMPYQPDVLDASTQPVHPHHYRLAGLTCLAGDIIGDYYLKDPLHVGSRVVFSDMLHYTMVKNTTFNGIGLPSIAMWSEESGLSIVKEFGYDDYRSRLS